MMQPRSTFAGARRAALILCSGGCLLNATCNSAALEAIIIGLDAAAQQIRDEDDEVTFGDWLESEFDDWFD